MFGHVDLYNFGIVRIILCGSLSGSDEVDIIWIIDTKSIEVYGSDIIAFIGRIADGYCNEYAGFSVVLYGDTVPSDTADIVVLKLIDTEPIALRSELKTLISDTLTPTFTSVKSASNTDPKSIPLQWALSSGDRQTQPMREAHKSALYGADYDIGLHDDYHRFFVFDYDESSLNDANIAAMELHSATLKEPVVYSTASVLFSHLRHHPVCYGKCHQHLIHLRSNQRLRSIRWILHWASEIYSDAMMVQGL